MPVFRFLSGRIIQRRTTKRKHAQLMSRLMRLLMLRHLRETIPGHFTPKGGQKYHYSRRRQTYLRRKLRKYGHQDPLVWSGSVKKGIQQRSRITATQHRARLYYRFGRHPMHPQHAHEIELILKKEQREMAKRLRGYYARAVKTPAWQAKRALRF